MLKEIKDLMTLIELNGYVCYIVGGYVRDKLLNIKSQDYDLCTNAHIDVLQNILTNYEIIAINYTTIALKVNSMVIEITSFRKELAYERRKPIKYEYVDTLKEDLIRRDFTINSICLNKDGQYIDLLDGITDLKHKVIKGIGNNDLKLVEDPLRILRAIRFSAYLNFKIEPSLEDAISKNSYLVANLSYEKRKEEIDKLIKLKKLSLLKKYNLDKFLEINIDNIKYYDDNTLMWLQLDINNKYHLTKKERKLILEIRNLLNEGISNYTIYKYGYLVSSKACLYLNINFNSIYLKLPIKTRKDIKVNNKDILKYIDLKQYNNIIKEIEKNILLGNLDNTKQAVESYLINKKR